MNFNKLTKTFLMFASFFLLLPVQAQVTVGNNEAPVDGALLQIKETAGVAGKAKNSSKGVIFPRVALSQKDRLYPMFGEIGSENPSYTSDRTAINTKHAGMVVYNIYSSPSSVTNPNLIFQEGLYVWLGDKWASVGTPSVENALTLTNAGVVQLGGLLTEDTTRITADNKNLIIDLKNIVDNEKHGFMIRGLKTQLNSGYLVADYKTGKIGMGPDIPAVMAFMQSKDQSSITTSAIRTGVVVPWTTSDIVNNSELVDLQDSGADENSFVMKKDANVEISAYVCYIGGGVNYTSALPMEIVVNATIQIKRVGGSWEDYSSVRGVYANSVSWYINTLNVPPVLLKLNSGDKIRLRLIQPPAETTQLQAPNGGIFGYLGANHNGAKIAKPYGTQFSKGMKIIVQ